MGSLIQNTVFGRAHYKVNTYIGGVGGTINTPALLASKLGIAANRIKLFRIINNDIECSVIGGTYSLQYGVWINSNLTYFIDDANLATVDNSRAFRTATLLTKIKLNGLTNAGDESFTNTNLIEISLPSVKDLTGTYGSFRLNSNVKRIILPEAINSTWVYSGMDNCYSLETVYIPKLAILRNGAAAGLNNYVFSGSKIGLKIYASPLAQTSYLGGVDKDIAWAIANRSASVRYVTDFTKPNAITNLSATAVYNKSLQLNFTPSSSLNGIDYYEVYVNGVYKQDIKNNGEIIAGLDKNTNYNIQLIAVDNFYNKSVFSNTTNITTGNLNLDVDAENFMIASQNYDYQNVINNLIVSLKANNLWNKIQAAYPFIGSTQINHKFNLKNPLDTNTAFRLLFNGSSTHSINGYQTNGSNAYANTFLNVNTYHTFSNAGLTMVCGTNNVPFTTNSFDLGAQKSSSPWECYQIHLNHGALKNNNVFVVGTIGISKTAVNNARGIHTISKTTNTEARYSKNGNLDTAVTGTQTGIVPILPYFIGCLNNGGSPFGYSNQRIQFTAIHEGLTDTEVQAFHTIIDTFENALGRKTW